MQRWVITVGISAVVAAGGVARAGAQSSSTQQAVAPGKPAILTVTGCLRNGPDPDTYVLSNLKWKAPAAATGTTGSTAESGAPAAAASATSLRLVGGSAIRLGEHLGRTVEVTGILTDESAPNPALSEGEAERRARTGTGGDQTTREEQAKRQPRPEQTLSVRTVRVVGGTCADGPSR